VNADIKPVVYVKEDSRGNVKNLKFNVKDILKAFVWASFYNIIEHSEVDVQFVDVQDMVNFYE